MKSDLTVPVLETVSRVIEKRSGLAFPPEKWPELRKGLAEAAAMLGLPDAREMADRFLSPSAPAEWTALLLDRLTIGETYFFREPDALEGLEKQIIPDLIRKRKSGSRTLRIWSAGCSTGEEAYTLSILLLRAIPDIERWDVSVLATDLNTGSLKKAREGRYTAWSFRGTPEWVRTGYFHASGNQAWTIAPAVRKLVRFERLNLTTDTYPASWNGTAEIDLILCRNVLMYFAPDRVEKVLRGFNAALAPGGFLVVSANELSMSRFEGFERVDQGKAFCFRKLSDARRRSAAASDAATRPPSRRIPAKTASPSPPAAGTSSAPPARAGRPVASAPAAAAPVDSLAAARQAADAGRFDEAAMHCRVALEANPMDPAGYYLYGVVLQEKGDPTAAAREFRRAIYLDPDFVAPYVSLGNLLQASGNREEAKRQLSNALSILERYPGAEFVRESDGTTVAALAAMIRSIESDSGERKGG
jgi:chemotaxis protein methyltransferase CheR